MKLLLLRGQVPTDRGKDGWKEILYPTIGQCDDIYTLMAHALTPDMKNDWCEVVYWGHDRQQMAAANMWEIWKKDLADYRPAMDPDVIWARGGFPEYEPVLRRYPNAFKIYYGAGKRFVPTGFTDYNLVLVDCDEQRRIVEKKFPGIFCQVWFKPAPPQFVPMATEKKYDVCFVAVHPEDERKRVQWVYDTVPRDLKVLQIGGRPKTCPTNVRVTRALRCRMPALMNQCRVGVVPYTKDDSGPRVLSEFLACRIPVVCSKELRMPWGLPRYEDPRFWGRVRAMIDRPTCPRVDASIDNCAFLLRHLTYGRKKEAFSEQ